MLPLRTGKPAAEDVRRVMLCAHQHRLARTSSGRRIAGYHVSRYNSSGQGLRRSEDAQTEKPANSQIPHTLRG